MKLLVALLSALAFATGKKVWTRTTDRGTCPHCGADTELPIEAEWYLETDGRWFKTGKTRAAR